MPTDADRETFRSIDIWVDDPSDRIAAKIAFVDARQGLPADDLRALNIDRADLRWAAARGYIAAEREKATRALNRTLICIFAAGMMEQSAAARGSGNWINRLDILDAIARIKRSFGERAAQIVTKTFLPASLRDET
jgi:hypothetical protein